MEMKFHLERNELDLETFLYLLICVGVNSAREEFEFVVGKT